MKHIISAIRLTAVLIIVFGVIYPLFVLGIGVIFPKEAKGNPVIINGKHIGFEAIGQKFTSDAYFWGRPSAVDYNAAQSGASNASNDNQDYLKSVKARIDTFEKHNPEIKRNEIPVELVTASGSGLDPHISIPAANVQVARIAKIRNVNANEIRKIIIRNTEKPLLGFIGIEKVNVLKLNLSLEKLNR